MSKIFLRDLAERAISTYLQVVLPAITAAVITDWSLLWPVLLSGIPAVLSVLKSLIAARIPGTVSPASFATAKFGGADFHPSLTAGSYRDEA